jgi:hypothetical protein
MTQTPVKSAFAVQQFPYLFTVLVGIIAWLITHVADRLAASPIVAYTVSSYRIASGLNADYKIENISNDKLIENIDFILVSMPGDSIIDCKYELLAPLKSQPTEDYLDKSSQYTKFHLSGFQPHCALMLHSYLSGNEPLPLRFSSKSPALLEESGIDTFILKHEIGLLTILVIVGTLLLVFYYRFYKKLIQ